MNNINPEQRKELLRALKARFEKNMNRHKGLEWLRYKQSWKLILKNSGHSMKWRELAVNRMLLVTIKRRVNTFFVIGQRKALKAAEAFVTTVKPWSRGKNINQKITLLISQLPWASKF